MLHLLTAGRDSDVLASFVNVALITQSLSPGLHVCNVMYVILKSSPANCPKICVDFVKCVGADVLTAVEVVYGAV